jgi:hypothetical protein
MNEREKFKQEVMREVMAYVDNAARAWEAKSEPSFFDLMQAKIEEKEEQIKQTKEAYNRKVDEIVAAITPPQSPAMAWTNLSGPHGIHTMPSFTEANSGSKFQQHTDGSFRPATTESVQMGDNRMGGHYHHVHDPSYVEPETTITTTPDPHTVYKEASVKERWKPEAGEVFWFMVANGAVTRANWSWHEQKLDGYAFGNCFQTKEEAEAARDRVKALLLSK